ncbi:2-oxoacid:acceptor oxidoreductase subunit alpha [Rubeoparvulum massiliense]|uniref:2-oxoacid:acceptor oxidoreductase subunit alpha n=1 Tax=Rubeoparvulum massiliense TaxID=1631346 RepID=UPI00065E3B10|nr:2-oxoacid:acceptor oxidoreductase subunit alpha [Rubeoparvulum massiliense]
MIKAIQWKVGGQQGEGVDSTGEVFARTLFRYGYHVTTYKQFMSRIKGGHTDYKIRATQDQTYYAGDQVDILLCLDKDTLPLNEQALVENGVAIVEGKEIHVEKHDGKQYVEATFPMKELATQLGNPLAKNMIALGISGALIQLPKELFYEFIEDVFAKKGAEVIQSNKAAVDKGYELVEQYLADYIQKLEPVAKEERLYLSGNEATAFGSFMAGCRFLSAYPITPASEIMEWMSANLPKVGGTVLQVEDEIAGVTFAIGASYAGARAMTSTSGPGLSLKTEALGLAGMSETPLVIVNSQRGGPSTGLPTKYEQSDLQQMLYAGHGEIPRIVIYPSTIEDAFYLAAEAFNLAEQYQCPVIVGLDLALSMNKTTIPAIDANRVQISRGKLLSPDEVKSLDEHIFKRYRFTKDGISPRAIPGMEGGIHTASSNEHNEEGYITEDPAIRTQMMNKRLGKVEQARIATPYYLKNEDAEVMVVGMGSTRGVIEESIAKLAEEGIYLGHIQLQQISPFPMELAPYLKGKRVISVENNYFGQLLNVIKMHLPIHEKAAKITQYDGNPFTMERVYRELKELI